MIRGQKCRSQLRLSYQSKIEANYVVPSAASVSELTASVELCHWTFTLNCPDTLKPVWWPVTRKYDDLFQFGSTLYAWLAYRLFTFANKSLYRQSQCPKLWFGKYVIPLAQRFKALYIQSGAHGFNFHQEWAVFLLSRVRLCHEELISSWKQNIHICIRDLGHDWLVHVMASHLFDAIQWHELVSI